MAELLSDGAAPAAVETAPANGAPPATPAPSPVQPAPAASGPPSSGPAPTDWRASLPDDLKANKSLERYKDVASVAKAYVEMEKYQGTSVRIPGEDATPQEQQAFWSKLGVPDKADKYEVKAPDGHTFDPALVAHTQQMFHHLHLTPAQAQGLLSFYTGTLANPKAFAEQLRTEAVGSLKAEWGGAFDFNVSRADRAARLLDQQSGAGFLEMLKEAGLTNDKRTVKFYHWLDKQFAEDGDFPMSATGVMGPDDAKAEIDAIRANPAHPYHKGDKEAVAHVSRLYEIYKS